MGFGFGFDLFDIVFPIAFFGIFAIVMALFAVTVAREVKKEKVNARAPRLSVHARVISKRQETHGRNAVSTDYFVTFEVNSGDRMELETEGGQYGLLAENDEGTLTFQGTEYLSFERDEW